MADLTISIPDGQQTTDALLHFGTAQGYTGTFNGSPETRAAFARRIMAAWVKAQILEGAATTAANSARAAALATANAITVT